MHEIGRKYDCMCGIANITRDTPLLAKYKRVCDPVVEYGWVHKVTESVIELDEYQYLVNMK